MRCFFILIASVVSASEARRAAQPDIYALAEIARAAPPEFAAWGLLRIVEGNRLRDPAWEAELIEEALQFARNARHPMPKRLAPGIAPQDSRAAYWDAAYRLGLDRLSLEMRAIARLAAKDKRKAAERIAQRQAPQPSSPPCEQPLVDDPSLWYDTARKLSPSQESVLAAIRSVHSHSAIAGAARTILSRRGPPEELPIYIGALAQALTNLEKSDRAFQASLEPATNALNELNASLLLFKEPRAALAGGWRAWLLQAFEQPACAESANFIARREAAEAHERAIGISLPENAWKAALGKPAETHSFPPNGAQAARMRRLMFGETGALSAAAKDTAGWRGEFQSFLSVVATESRTSDESDEDFFVRRATSWTAAILAAPPGSARDRAIEEFIAFALANAASIDPLLWYSQIERMASGVRALHGAGVMDALERTGHPILLLAMRLDRVFPAIEVIR